MASKVHLSFRPAKNDSVTVISYVFSDEAPTKSCLAIQFFDDEELVVLLEDTDNGERKRYIATIKYTEDKEDMRDPSGRDDRGPPFEVYTLVSLERQMLMTG